MKIVIIGAEYVRCRSALARRTPRVRDAGLAREMANAQAKKILVKVPPRHWECVPGVTYPAKPQAVFRPKAPVGYLTAAQVRDKYGFDEEMLHILSDKYVWRQIFVNDPKGRTECFNEEDVCFFLADYVNNKKN